MKIRTAILLSTVVFGLEARATGLLGAGKTVQAFYYNSVLANPEGEIPVGASSTAPASLIAPVNYQQGAADGSLLMVGDTQIVITNILTGAPFCLANTPGTACVDQIDGFDFLFTGEDILGVTVDPASAADFLPVSGTFQGNTHLGLQLISPNEIRVDVTGDLPALDDQLILDPSFAVTATPEPGTLPVVALALGLGLLIKFRAR